MSTLICATCRLPFIATKRTEAAERLCPRCRPAAPPPEPVELLSTCLGCLGRFPAHLPSCPTCGREKREVREAWDLAGNTLAPGIPRGARLRIGL